jgi:FkbM family methyltransferase
MEREVRTTMGARKPLRLGIAQGVCRRLPPLVSARVRHWIYPRALSVKDDYEFIASAVTGGVLRGVTSDVFTYSFGVHGYHEWRLLAIAIALCGPGDTIMEVGANVGTETVCFADIVGRAGKVLAFEPLPALRAKLDEAIERNGYKNLVVLPFAVGSECGEVEFTLPPFENSGLGFVVREGATVQGERVKVELRTLDSMREELGPVRLIVADIEGSEHAMLRGGRGYIGEHRPALVLEAHAKNASQLGTTLRAVHDELRSLGYEVHTITRLGLVPPDLGSDKLMTWFCVHESRREDVARVRGAFLRCGLLPLVRGLNPLAIA